MSTAPSSTPPQNPPAGNVAPILGRIPSGIYVLTAKNGPQETGMLASWVMQAGFEPPMVSVAIKQGRDVAQWLRGGQPFVLNVVGHGQIKTLKHFARGFAADEPAFTGIAIERSAADVPILTEALGYLECEPTGSMDSGDHHIFLARITGGNLARDEEPMVHVRKNGMKY
jgi:flavin reductase (DIM6/NTAB) family NADH-FMN oxidoreductase RutF